MNKNKRNTQIPKPIIVEIPKLPDINYDELDPGIRNMVKVLRDNGFNTTDSGDGSKSPTMEGAVDFPMIAVRTEASILCSESDRMFSILEATEPDRMWHVQASYDPQDGVSIIIACADE